MSSYVRVEEEREGRGERAMKILTALTGSNWQRPLRL